MVTSAYARMTWVVDDYVTSQVVSDSAFGAVASEPCAAALDAGAVPSLISLAAVIERSRSSCTLQKSLR